MPLAKPFGWLLVLGTLCSAAGLVVVLLPGGTSAAEQASPPDMSAFEALSTPETGSSEAVVTEASPLSPAASETEAAPTEPVNTAVAQLAATPTPAAALAVPPASTVQSMPANVSQAVDVPRVVANAQGLFEAMNEARRAEGLGALQWDASLEEVAYARAANLVANGYFEHYGPDGESAFSELAARGIRYRLAGENLARNNYAESRTVAAAFDGLMNSPGHRANILEERFSSVGVAAVKDGKMWIYVTVFLN